MNSPKKSYMVPVMNGSQSSVFKGLVFVWFVMLIWFWAWWLQGEHLVTPFGMWLSSFVLFFTTVIPGWFFFFASRMKMPNPKATIPDGNIGVFVTKVPSESFTLVIKPTLEAVLLARKKYLYPQNVTIYLCDEDPEHDTDYEWCADNGIEILSRKGLKSYHNEEFPRRTKTKEGNLSYAYDILKAQDRLPDFLIQLDADHVPTETYIVEMMRAFADPTVGYVAAPSICDKNDGESWVVRARLFAEATMHGCLQAGYNQGWAPMPIGSHYAMRSEAFLDMRHPKPKSFWDRTVTWVQATLGPELAEDHSTGLAMNAAGWRGAFALNAIAHGDGAASFADSILQEFQWSRSLMVVLLKWTPMYFKSKYITKPLRIEYLFAQSWYPLFALYMLIGYLMPPLAIMLRTPWVNVSYGDWLLHSIPLIISCLLPVAYLQHHSWARPATAPVMSWETYVFQLVRWPWALWGVIHGFIGTVILNKELPFKVTPKGVQGAKPLPLKVLLPYFVIILVQLVPMMIFPDAGQAKGYYWFALLNAVTYIIVVMIIITKHLQENAHATVSPVRYYLKPIAVTAVFLVFVLSSVVWKGPEAVQSIFADEIEQISTAVSAEPTPAALDTQP